MLVRVSGAKCTGIDAVRVTVEIEVTSGIGIHLVGLADAAVKESLLRTTTALQSMGFRIPGKKIIINLAPADLRKNGTGYDLPIAVGIIAASGQMELPGHGRYLMMGELGLNGEIRPIPEALPYAELAAREGLNGCILPEESALEAVEMKEVDVFGVRTLSDVLAVLSGREDCSGLLIRNSGCFRELQEEKRGPELEDIPDFKDIVGQEEAKRGMEVAAAGGHNVLMVGSPGSGKSTLARAMAGILPPMTREEAMVTSKIYSVAGRGSLRYGLMKRRPFRSPHYSASLSAMIGGGGGNIMPGEVSLAQHGVLFLDEFGQMPKSTVEALRGPMEDRKVTISRLRSKVEYPSSFMLVAASNPCPCGYYGEGDRCRCTPGQRRGYISRLSGPILDRIDIQLVLHPVDSNCLAAGRKAEPSADVAARVSKAREIQEARFSGEGLHTNAEMTGRLVEKHCPLSPACAGLLARMMDKCWLSMRAYFRIIKVARTIADLEGSPDILERHLAEAAAYRILDRPDGS